MPTLKLAGTRPSAKATPKRKPAAPTPKRKPAAAAKATPKRKPAAAAAAPAPAAENGRIVKLPEGWSQADLRRVMKDMQKARKAKEAAAEALAEAQTAVNAMALDLIDQGVQMSVVVDEEDGLAMSRQWLYNLMQNLYEDYGYTAPVQTERQAAAAKPKRKAAPKATAKKRPAAKPVAKVAPARKRPATAAKKAPARKRPAGVVRLAA